MNLLGLGNSFGSVGGVVRYQLLHCRVGAAGPADCSHLLGGADVVLVQRSCRVVCRSLLLGVDLIERVVSVVAYVGLGCLKAGVYPDDHSRCHQGRASCIDSDIAWLHLFLLLLIGCNTRLARYI